MNAKSAPGPDGILLGKVKFFMHIFLPIMYNLFNSWISHTYFKTLSLDSYITLFVKSQKKPLDHNTVNIPSFKEMHVINIENVDAKLFAKILNFQLGTHINKFIMPFQFVVSSRSIHTPLIILEDALSQLRASKSTTLYGIFLDFHRAFDNVNLNILAQKILSCFKYSNLTIGLLNYIMNKTTALKIGNNLYNPFDVEKGILQGSPLSTNLYCLYINDLLCSLSDNLPGLYVKSLNLHIKVLAFADDILVLCEDQDEIQIALEIISEFCNRTGSDLNSQKSVILNMRNFEVVKGLGNQVPRAYLGIPFPLFMRDSRNSIQERIYTNIQGSVQQVCRAFLSIPLKVKIINSFYIPKMIYYFQHIKFTKKFYSSIKTLFLKLIWSGRLPLFSFKKMCVAFKGGGLSLIDPFSLSLSVASNAFFSFLQFFVQNSFNLPFLPMDTPPPWLRSSKLFKLSIGFRELADDLNLTNPLTRVPYSLLRQSLFPPRNQLQYVPYGNRFIKLAIDSFLPPNIIYFTFKLVNGVLPVNKRLCERYGMRVEPLCTFCDMEEDLNHLFFKCTHFRNAISSVSRYFHLELDRYGSTLNLFLSNYHNFEKLRIFILILFAVWKLRCFKIFENMNIEPRKYIHIFIEKIYKSDECFLPKDTFEKLWNPDGLNA